MTLHCHTDGSNAIEDNGPGAIVAISQYLARLPRTALPHTIMILLTTGHFAGGNGSRAFRKRHADDLVERTNAAVTIEHLGLNDRRRQALHGRLAAGSPPEGRAAAATYALLGLFRVALGLPLSNASLLSGLVLGAGSKWRCCAIAESW